MIAPQYILHDHDVLDLPWPALPGPIRLAITSPPYYRCRDYHTTHGRQIGREDTLDTYLFHLACVMDTLKAHVAPDGHVAWNMGDFYTKKSLQLAPHHFARMAVTSNWVLRNTIVWAKQILFPDDTTVGSVKPHPVKDRFNSAHEYVFLLNRPRRAPTWLGLSSDGRRGPATNTAWKFECANHWKLWEGLGDVAPPALLPISHRFAASFKASTYRLTHYFDLDSVRVPSTHPSPSGTVSEPSNLDAPEIYGEDDAENRGRTVAHLRTGVKNHPIGKNPPDAWQINTSGARDIGHFAVFPPALCARFILACSAPGDWILDPFCGTSSAGEIALRLGRNFIGIDNNPSYLDLSHDRLFTAL